eukprot:1190321-Prorocentrum_minimum.AAC.2
MGDGGALDKQTRMYVSNGLERGEAIIRIFAIRLVLRFTGRTDLPITSCKTRLRIYREGEEDSVHEAHPAHVHVRLPLAVRPRASQRAQRGERRPQLEEGGRHAHPAEQNLHVVLAVAEHRLLGAWVVGPRGLGLGVVG